MTIIGFNNIWIIKPSKLFKKVKVNLKYINIYIMRLINET